MGKITGFLEYERETPDRRPVLERVNDWFEVYQDLPPDRVREQAGRCMDCGVPFCHTGCPVNSGKLLVACRRRSASHQRPFQTRSFQSGIRL